MPARIIRVGIGPGQLEIRRRTTDPLVGCRIPESTSTSSVWPLPETPATPTISPARTSSDTSETAGSPVRSGSVQAADTEHRLAGGGAGIG